MLFKDLLIDDLNTISDSSCFFEYNENEKIFSQGDKSNSILIIQKGVVSLQINNQEVAERSTGEILGEQGVLDDCPRSTDAVTKRKTTIFYLEKNDFYLLKDKNPNIMINLTKILSEKLRQSSNERGIIYKRDFFLRQFISKNVSKRAYGEIIQKIDALIPEKIDKLDIDPPKKVSGFVQFIDIRSFTTLSEKYGLEIIQKILIQYFNIVTKITNRYNGHIDKFLGDGVLIYYIGKYDKISEDVINASFQIIQEINKHEFCIEEKMKIGIGIDSGEFLFGPFGSVLRMEYTIIGDTVNTASRIQDETKKHSTSLMISNNVYKNCTVEIQRNFEEVGNIELRNKINKIKLYKKKDKYGI